MFCAYTRLRYQVCVYRTIGPLVVKKLTCLVNAGSIGKYTVIFFVEKCEKLLLCKIFFHNQKYQCVFQFKGHIN